jgi:hypothetical protein
MRWTSNDDLAAFDEVDSRRARFDAHVAAAAQNGFRLAVNYFDAHRAAYGNGFAVDEANGVCSGLIRPRCGKMNRAEAKNYNGKRENPRDSNRMEEKPLGLTRGHIGGKSHIYYTCAGSRPHVKNDANA